MLHRFAIAIAAIFLLSTTALARSTPSESSQAKRFPAPPIRARAALVMDATNGVVLASKNAHLRLPMASTTKIMTGLLGLQLGHLSDRITVPGSAFNFESDATVMGLHSGQVVTLKDLLYGLMLPSGADAANTIAIHYGGSESRFVGLMNQEAALLGMKDTHYANAHGLTAKNHYTSAFDLATLAQYVSYQPVLMKVASTRQYSWNGHVLTNVNRVLFWYPGLDGIKPGYTNDAGLCQVLDAQRHGHHVVVALLNTPDLDVDARNLLNFGLQDYSWTPSRLPGDAPSLLVNGQDGSGPYFYFVGSGHYVRGKLWNAFLADGGLPALGFPRTEPLQQGSAWVQYFQNGALSQSHNGTISRLPLGLTAVPDTTVTPTAAVPTSTPYEGTVNLKPGTATKTPTPIPHATPTPLPGPSGPPTTAKSFQPFYKTHHSLLGSPAGASYIRHGYLVQVFAYGALVHAPKSKTVMLLPLGDRFLAFRHWMPIYPGDTYPQTFAPTSALKAIGWQIR